MNVKFRISVFFPFPHHDDRDHEQQTKAEITDEVDI